MQHRHPARSGLSLVLAALVLGPSAGAASGGEASSGPPVGGKTRPFTVQDVTGQAKGGRICYV